VWRQLAFIFSVPLSPALSSMYRLSIQQELLFGIRFRTQSSLSPNRKKQQDNFRHRLQRPAHCDRYTDREYLLGSRERIRAVPAHISLHARSSKGLGQVRKASYLGAAGSGRFWAASRVPIALLICTFLNDPSSMRCLHFRPAKLFHVEWIGKPTSLY
jgi:hypothetical protein